MTITTTDEARAIASRRGYSVRDNPLAEVPYLRCQIGKESVESRILDGGPSRGELLTGLKFFKLVAFGPTWCDALAKLGVGR